MQTRVAVMGIVVENTDSVERLNTLLHEYGSYIIGRMGIPYRARNINIVSIAIDASQDVIGFVRQDRQSGRYQRQDRILQCAER